MLLVLLLSVYVNLVKELFLLVLLFRRSHQWLNTRDFWKASAKVHLFRELAKCFRVFFQKEADFSRLFDKGQGERAIEWGKPCGKTAGHSKGAEGVREGVRRGAGYYRQINVRVRMCDEFISYML